MTSILSSLRQLFNTGVDDKEADFIYFWDDVEDEELVSEKGLTFDEYVSENTFVFSYLLLMILAIPLVILAFISTEIILVLALTGIYIGLLLSSFLINKQRFVKPYEILKSSIQLLETKKLLASDELLYTKSQIPTLEQLDNFRLDLTRLFKNFSYDTSQTKYLIQNLQDKISLINNSIDNVNLQIDNSFASVAAYQESRGSLLEISEGIDKFTQNFDNALDGIEEISSVIKSIGSQTTMLGLNAGIEAARAGDKGKGFEVVASNLRRLAQHAIDSSTRIRGMSKEINQNAKLAIEQITNNMGNLQQKMENNYKSISELNNELYSSILQITNLQSDFNKIVETASNSLSEIGNYEF